ncbi:MAG: lysophospholipid acyltransferase family protein [Acidimicrobiaceae bacterium]|nr:1-acyl-sn-glycerol-3-phosphate acyltransferase [Acidimicrobiia bacterium]MCY4493692.1 lysophospholipid acyltransferase family protein [Acidimicrobiaceae bacterium]
MSRLAKQLDLPPLPRGLSPVRRYRNLGFPYRAPSTPRGVAVAPETANRGADYDTAWARKYPARLARAAIVDGPMRLAVFGLAAPDRRGQDRLASLQSAAIFAANHHSHLDTPLLLTSIPEPWRHQILVGAAADYFFGTRLTSALSSLVIGAIPIERSRVSRRSADQAAELAAQGWSLLLFPEGGRSPDGWGQPFRGGAAYLAQKSGRPVVPIHIEGTGRILRKGRSLPQPSTASVTFGKPLVPASAENTVRFAARIEAEVAALADEASSDWYQARVRAHARATPQLTGPTTGAWRRAWSLGDRSRRARQRKRRWPNL